MAIRIGLPWKARDARNALARRDLYEYMKLMWPVVEGAEPFVESWHLIALCEIVEAVTRGEIKKLVINIGPRLSKSTIFSKMWPTWEWLERPHTRWLTGSYALQLAIRDCLHSRRIIESPLYRELNTTTNARGEAVQLFELCRDQNMKSRYENNKTGHRIACAVDAKTTGEGGDRLTVDDPHNARRLSLTKLQAAISWWVEAMSSRLNKQDNCAKVIIAQRVHDNDLSGYVLREKDGYLHACFPTEFNAKNRCLIQVPGILVMEDPRQVDGEIIDPIRLPDKAVADLKIEMGDATWAGQHNQSPAIAGGNIIKIAKLMPMLEWPSDIESIITSTDASFRGKKENEENTTAPDYCVITRWGKGEGSRRYLLDLVKGQWDINTLGIMFKAFVNSKPNWCPDAIWPLMKAKQYTHIVEAKANGQALIDMATAHVQGVQPFDPNEFGDKVLRANLCVPMIMAGNVWIPDQSLAEWVGEYLLELEQFPRHRFDDQVDSTTQALLFMKEESSAWDAYYEQQRRGRAA